METEAGTGDDCYDRSIHSTNRVGVPSVTIMTRVARLFSWKSCLAPARASSTVPYRTNIWGELVDPPLTLAMSLNMEALTLRAQPGGTARTSRSLFLVAASISHYPALSPSIITQH